MSLIGGILNGALSIVNPAAGVALKLGRSAVGAAKGLSPKAWLAIGAAILLVVGVFVHRHAEAKALAAAYAQGAADSDAGWSKRLNRAHADALAWKAKAEAKAAAVTNDERTRNDQALHDIHARADDQRLHGPGKAAAPACAGPGADPGLPGSAGGHGPPGGDAGAGLAGLPPESGLAIVPWDDLVALAAQADANRAEALTWREWYKRQDALNRQERESAPTVPTTPPK